MEKLIGQQLLSQMEKLGGMSIAEQAKAAGYFRVMDDGATKALLSEFYEAVAEAQKQSSEGQPDASTLEPDPSSIEYWSALSDEQTENLICYMNIKPPVEIIPALSSSKTRSVRASIAGLIETPAEIIEDLLADDDTEVRSNAAISMARILTGWRTPAHELFHRLRTEALNNDLALRLFSLQNDDLKEAIAVNPAISEELIMQFLEADLAEWLQITLRQSLAKRKLPRQYLDMNEDDVIKSISAALPDESVLEGLVNLFLDSDLAPTESLCFLLAKSPTTPPKVLALLASNCDQFVLQALARNTELPLFVLEDLADLDDCNVRRLIALNPKTSLKLLEKLAADRVETVRSAAGLRLLPDEWKSLEPNQLREKLRLEKVSDEIQFLFVGGGDSELLISIASNPSISECVQRRLAADIDARVISALAANPTTTKFILELIAKEWRDDATVQAAINSRNLPASLAELSEAELINNILRGDVLEEQLPMLFRNCGCNVKQAILSGNSLAFDDKRILIEQYNEMVYGRDWKQLKVFSGLHKKGWMVVATSAYILNSAGQQVSADAKQQLQALSKGFVSLLSETKTCWSSSFVREGYPACTPLFYVVDPCGDCLESLVDSTLVDGSSVDKKPASLHRSIDEALASNDLLECGRLFICVGFTYTDDDGCIEEDDLGREVSVDEGEKFVNFPSMSKQLEEGIELYFKPHPSHGDSRMIVRMCWEEGELTETSSLQNKLSLALKELNTGNPFLSFYL